MSFPGVGFRESLFGRIWVYLSWSQRKFVSAYLSVFELDSEKVCLSVFERWWCVSFFASDSLPVNLSLGFVQKRNKIIKEPFTFALRPSRAEPSGYFEIENCAKKRFKMHNCEYLEIFKMHKCDGNFIHCSLGFAQLLSICST